ncbi:MAG TPA: hypothetical protein VF223_04805 [Trebonia sp.]
MRRDLLDLASGQTVGSLTLEGDVVTFDRYANSVLRNMRAKLGDLEAAKQVMADGWSNGYLYFADPTP